MRTSIEDFHSWLNVSAEHERLEFKEAKHQFDTNKLFKYCVAMANEGGGKLILGVTDKIPRRVVGTEAFPDIFGIQGKILQKLGCRVDVEALQHPEGRALVFHIPARPRGTAYQFEGAYLMRSGEELIPMTEDRLRAIFEEGKPDWLAQTAHKDVTSDEVVKLLDTQSYFDLLKLPYPAQREGVLEKFTREKLIRARHDRWEITNLGAILFAKDLKEFEGLSRRTVRIIVYEGKGKLRTRLDKFDTKGYAVGFEALIDTINSLLPSNEEIGKALRKTVKMFPEEAIRELVANALIHQDFNETGASTVIEIYQDRIEISNPGTPFIPTERFIDEYQSRNERLADLMRRLGICEEKGSGIDKVIQSVEVFQLPAPDFRVGEKHTTAVMFGHKLLEEMDSRDKIRACYQHCCLRYVMNEKMTNQSLRERFKLAEDKSDYASRIIRDTLEAKIIKLDDPTNTSKRYAKYIPFWA
ncbi:MAG: MloB [Omnitrophica bacterium GWA2_50_21]|nr:MAG: MloB [Omnitrophica bacterium GWA2_50_21]